MERNKNLELFSFSLVHFIVDLCCIFLMTAFVLPLMENSLDWLWCVVLYNLFAFALQLPIGALGDLIGRPGKLSSFGCFLIALSYFIIGFGFFHQAKGLSISVITASIIAGIGNACFHVGGGISTIHDSKGKATRPGIFVSTGAMGVFLAPKLAAGTLSPILGLTFGVILMVFSGVFLLAVTNTPLGSEDYFDISKSASQIKSPSSSSSPLSLTVYGYLAILFLLITVCIRSYTGGLMSYTWKSAPLLGFLFTLGVVLGKMLGGIIGDRIGWIRSSVGSLLISALFLHFAPSGPFFGIVGVLLFNMTMPITLMAISNLLGKGYSGTAFGMTTLALFLGTLPSALEYHLGLDLTPAWMITPTIVGSAIAISAGILLAASSSLSSKGTSVLSESHKSKDLSEASL